MCWGFLTVTIIVAVLLIYIDLHGRMDGVIPHTTVVVISIASEHGRVSCAHSKATSSNADSLGPSTVASQVYKFNLVSSLALY